MVHQSMSQAPIKDHVPFFWSTMSQVKFNHYLAMAHFFVASALVDHQCKTLVWKLHLTIVCDFLEEEELNWSHSGEILHNYSSKTQI